MRPTVWISKVSLCDSRNFTKICARGQSQPVSIACLKIKNSIPLSGSAISSLFFKLSSVSFNQNLNLLFFSCLSFLKNALSPLFYHRQHPHLVSAPKQAD